MEIIASVLASIIVGIAAALLSSHLTLKRFRRQRLWEKKFTTYTEILDALFKIEIESRRSGGKELYNEQYKEGYLEQLKVDSRIAFRFLHKSAAIGKIVISTEAAEALEKFITETAEAIEKEGYWGETMMFTSDKAGECIEAIEKAAKEDLNIKYLDTIN